MAAGPKVQSRPRLGQSGPLTGEMHFAGINSARAGIGRALLRRPPEPVVFGPNPVEELTISYAQGRLRFELRVSGPVTEDIMVLGAAPCSAGWRKCRKPAYLGLLPVPQNGMSDITEMYVERYGEPKAGERVFIRTRQQTNGWEGRDKDISEVVPIRPLAQMPSGVQIRRPKAETRRKSEIRSPNAARSRGRLCSPGRLIHEACPREWLPISCLVPRWQCRWGRGCARGVGRVGRVWGRVRAGRRRSERPQALTLAPQLTGAVYRGARLTQKQQLRSKHRVLVVLEPFPSPNRDPETDYCLLITVYCLFRPPNRKSSENRSRPARRNRLKNRAFPTASCR